jgi:D-arabinose 1-dehydrogenase-like Zn-dependent alcohol dehydrogenase
METVGAATWSHSLKALKPDGVIVISGATSGPAPPAELNRIFFLQLRVAGSTMGTHEELARLMRMMVQGGIEPAIGETMPLSEARAGFEAMASGRTSGKIVFKL